MGSTSSVANAPASVVCTGAPFSRQLAAPGPIVCGAPHNGLRTFFVATPDGTVTAIRRFHKHIGIKFLAHSKSRIVGIGFVHCGASKPQLPSESDEHFVGAIPPTEVRRTVDGALYRQYAPAGVPDVPPVLSPAECDDVILTAANDGLLRAWESSSGGCIAEMAPFSHAGRVDANAAGIVSMAVFSPTQHASSTSVHDNKFVRYTAHVLLVAVDGRVAFVVATVRQGHTTLELITEGAASDGPRGALRRLDGSWLAEASHTPLAVRPVTLISSITPVESDDFARRFTAAVAASDRLALAHLTGRRTDVDSQDFAWSIATDSILLPQCRNGVVAVTACLDSRRKPVAFAVGFDAIVCVCMESRAVRWTAKGGHGAVLLSVCVSSDRTRLAVACVDGGVTIRSSSDGSIIDHAQSVHPRGPTHLHFLCDDVAVGVIGGGTPVISFVTPPAHPRHVLPTLVDATVLPRDVVAHHVGEFLARSTPTVA